MKDYTELNKSIIEHVGGVSNISDVIHCATRLRFTLKDPSKFDETGLKKIPGVLGVQKGAGTYHVLIGTQVSDVYEQMLAMPEMRAAGIQEKAAIDDPATAAADKKKVGLFDRFIRMMSDVYAPYIPILATGGIASGIIGLLANLGVVDSAGLTYQTFYAIFYALIYFFPILLAYTAAKHFHCNQYVAAALGAAILYPGVSDLLVTGEEASLLGIHFTAFNFGGSFIPILLAVWCMSYFEKWLKKVVPQTLQFILVPAGCLFVFVPLTILVFGPIGALLGNGIKVLYTALENNIILTDIIFGGLFSIIILLGMHWAVTPIQLDVMAAQGYEYALAAGGMGNYAVLGICLAVAVFAKNKNEKATASSAAFTDALCGITEPGLYGVILRNKKLIAAMVCSGALAGLVLGIGKVAATNFAFSGILSFGGWLNTINLPGYCIGIAVSIISGFISTMFLIKTGKVTEFDHE
jgi:PTS system beta-glucosides-specific IIC component